MALIFGNVPHPPFQDRPTSNSESIEGASWDRVSPRQPIGTCIHRMDGNLWGTDGYFRDPSVEALTDYGIGGQLDGESDGVILRWNDPYGIRAPWANGTPYGLEGDGQIFYDRFIDTPSAINALLVSIEVSGESGEGTEPETPVTENQLRSLAWLIAHFHDSFHVPWDQYPVDPTYEINTCLEHWEFAQKNCPFPILKSMRDQYQSMAREIMKYYQTGNTDPTPPFGTGIDTGPGLPARFKVNDKIEVSAGNPINLRSSAGIGASALATVPDGGELCVLSGPRAADAYTWYQVEVTATSQMGWVAGQLCSLITANGCGTGNPPGKFSVGDRIRVAEGPLNIRSTPGTSGGTYNGNQMQSSDALVAATRGLPETAISYARQHGAVRMDEVEAYINEIYRLAPTIGLDASILIAQSELETSAWSNAAKWWPERLNPAGLGVTGDTVQDEASQTFASGEAAARAQLAHMHAYVYGSSQSLPSVLVGADNRYQGVLDAGYGGIASIIDDLTNRWAMDDYYGDHIADRGNGIYGLSLTSGTSSAPSASIIGELPAGNEVCVTDGPQMANGIEWYKVNSDPVPGWIAGSYCTMVEAGACGGGSTPTARFAVGDKIQVFDGPLNVRQTASTSAAILDTFETGVELCVTSGPTHADGYEWFQIPAGWVAGDFCSLVRAGGCSGASTPGRFTVYDRVTVADGPLNIRSTPSTGGVIVGSYATDDEFCVTGGPVYADGFEWYESSLGWSAGDYCTLVGANLCNPASNGPFSREDRFYVADGPLNLRAAPGTTAAILGSLSQNVEGCVLDGPVSASGYTWYRVRAVGLEGWIASSYCGVAAYGGCRTTVDYGQFNPGDTIEIFDPPVNLRDAPSLSGNILLTFGQWTDFCVLNGPVYADGHEWYEVSRYGNQGWVSAIYFGLRAGGMCVVPAGGDELEVTPVDLSGVSAGSVLVVPEETAPISVRATASLTGTVLATLPAGSLAIVSAGPLTADNLRWYAVRAHGALGWVTALDMEKARTYTNLLQNPTAETNLTGIAANVPSTTVGRSQVDDHWQVDASNAGTAWYEGLRFDSLSNLGLTGVRFFAGTVEVSGSGVIDSAIVRIHYTDATSTESATASLVNLSPTQWQRIELPTATANSAKTIDTIDLRVRRHVAAGSAWTFHARDARVIEIS